MKRFSIWLLVVCIIFSNYTQFVFASTSSSIPQISVSRPKVIKLEYLGSDLYVAVKNQGVNVSYKYLVYYKSESGYKLWESKSGISSSNVIIVNGLTRNTTYYIQFQAYVLLTGLTSSSSVKSYFIHAGVVKSSATRKTIKNNSVVLKWDKTTGATKYIVYGSISKNRDYKRLAAVRDTKYKVKKIGKKKLDLKNKYAYFYIIPITKVSGSTIKASPYLYNSVINN